MDELSKAAVPPPPSILTTAAVLVESNRPDCKGVLGTQIPSYPAT